VPEQQDEEEAEELKRVNAKLRESLATCRFMLADARAKLRGEPAKPKID